MGGGPKKIMIITRAPIYRMFTVNLYVGLSSSQAWSHFIFTISLPSPPLPRTNRNITDEEFKWPKITQLMSSCLALSPNPIPKTRLQVTILLLWEPASRIQAFSHCVAIPHINLPILGTGVNPKLSFPCSHLWDGDVFLHHIIQISLLNMEEFRKKERIICSKCNFNIPRSSIIYYY